MTAIAEHSIERVFPVPVGDSIRPLTPF